MGSQPKSVTVVGLGKLGSPLAAVMAAKGFEVTGVDVNPRFIEAINEGQAPVEEPRLQDMIDRAEGRLKATTETADAVADSDVTFIIVPTPSKADGGFSLKYVFEACDDIADGLKRKDGYHLVVLTSTVMPGDTGGKVLGRLETKSGKTCGDDFGLCYNPEFIALGSVINDLLNPDFLLVGESDERAGKMLAGIHSTVCDNDPPVAYMNFVNAELAKLSVNTYVTTRISYANMLSQICERLPGADVDTVTTAIGLDSRIGSKHLKGALGYGGPCFPRDNIAFVNLARKIGASAILAEATDAMNSKQMDHLAETVVRHLPKGGTVGVLGLSYKPDTPVIEASASVDLVRQLVDRGMAVVVHDPMAMTRAKALFQDKVAYAETGTACAGKADVLVIATPWKEYAALTPDDLKEGGVSTVIDCWRVLPVDLFAGKCTHILLGKGSVQTERTKDDSGAATA